MYQNIAKIKPLSGRCCWHRADNDPILAHSGIFAGTGWILPCLSTSAVFREARNYLTHELDSLLQFFCNHTCISITDECTKQALIWNKKPWWFSDDTWAYRQKSPINPLFVQYFVTANNNENIKAAHYWPFVMGIHRSPVDSPHTGPVIRNIHRWSVASPHKGPLMRKALLCQDAIMGFTCAVHNCHPCRYADRLITLSV